MVTPHIRRLFSAPGWTVALILAGNLVPVLGVLFLGWDAAQILILYWTENVILGLLAVPRILAARSGEGTKPTFNIGVALFFLIHYGFFCFVHLIFALMLAGAFIDAEGGGDGIARTFGDPGFPWAVLSLFVIHLVSQIRDWWLAKAWRDASPTFEMAKPYGRIFVLHVTVLVGAWLMLAFGAPAWVVLVLCLAKATIELGAAAATGRLTLQRV